MRTVTTGIRQQFRQAVAQIRAQGGEIITAVLDTIVIELLSHTVRAAIHTGPRTRPVVFIGWRDGSAGAEQQRARDEQGEFRIAHSDFLISVLP
ncbi:hypothetical protein SDC9_202781 [bioreactor metagenome]|uniref:Uncharacterized protein n=1 Tax=bioreactor metagenome TaxID=1076179 RepID=A0A645IW58_9ZZZZ